MIESRAAKVRFAQFDFDQNRLCEIGASQHCVLHKTRLFQRYHVEVNVPRDGLDEAKALDVGAGETCSLEAAVHEGELADRGAFEVGVAQDLFGESKVGECCVAEIGAVERALAELRPSYRCQSEAAAQKARALGDAAIERRAGEVRVLALRERQVGGGEVRAGQARSRQRGAYENRVGEDRVAQVGVGQIRALQQRAREVRAAQVHAAQVRACQVEARYAIARTDARAQCLRCGRAERRRGTLKVRGVAVRVAQAAPGVGHAAASYVL